MQDTIQRLRQTAQAAREQAQDTLQGNPRQVAVVSLLVLLLAGGVVAQTTVVVSDDFEDEELGTVPGGWTAGNPTAEVRADSYEGNRSFYIATNATEGTSTSTWTGGPFLNMSEPFNVSGTMRSSTPGTVGTNAHVRVGLFPNVSDTTANALLMFNHNEDVTILSSDPVVDASTVSASQDNVLGNAFTGSWINIELWSEGNGILYAKVWPKGTAEPASAQLQENFSGVNGYFSINSGSNENAPRQMYLDSVNITGTQATLAGDPSLNLETRELFKHGATHPYSVTETRTSMGNNVSHTVTENASVESFNTDVLTVNPANNTLTATSDPNVTTTVIVKATYNNSTTYKEVVVAEPTLDNLAIIPTATWRINAVASNSTLFALLIATLLAVPMTRFTSAFGGLALAQMALVLAWFAGYVSFGTAAASLFVALFIGLNLAANIDYGVRRA